LWQAICNVLDELEGINQSPAAPMLVGEPPMFEGPAYEDMGKIEAGGEEIYAMMAPDSEPPKLEDYKLMRQAMDGFAVMMQTPDFMKYKDTTNIRRREIGGSTFHPMATRTYAYVHTPKGNKNQQNRKCMLFFHGGGAVSGTPEMMNLVMNRYVVEGDVNIINVKYGLAPESKVPEGIADAYAAFMDVRTNPYRFGCDPNKIGFFGESGGGYITAGLGLMLAERDQGHLARIQIQQTPMVTNLWFRPNWRKTPGLNEAERDAQYDHNWVKIYEFLSPNDRSQWMDDAYLFPNEMSDSLAAKVPPVVIVSGEFDFLRYASKEAADLYRRNGKLLAYIEFGGGYHASYHNFAMEQSNVWFRDFRRLMDFYLQ